MRAGWQTSASRTKASRASGAGRPPSMSREESRLAVGAGECFNCGERKGGITCARDSPLDRSRLFRSMPIRMRAPRGHLLGAAMMHHRPRAIPGDPLSLAYRHPASRPPPMGAEC